MTLDEFIAAVRATHPDVAIQLTQVDYMLPNGDTKDVDRPVAIFALGDRTVSLGAGVHLDVALAAWLVRELLPL